MKNSIYYKPIKHIYPDSQKISIENITIPSDLIHDIKQLEKVKRFDDRNYFLEDMIPDNTMAHTIRCIYRASTIPYSNKTLLRMLWVHDIPEVIVPDTMSMEKSNSKDVSTQIAQKEKKTAQELLNPEDRNLLDQFQTAENFLNDKSTKLPTYPEALLAKTIDFIDGNLIFHYFFTRWLKTNEYNGKNPPNSVFVYTLYLYTQINRIFANYNIQPDTQNACDYLLNSQLKQVLKLWNLVDKRKIPTTMQDYLIKTQDIIKKIPRQ